MGNISRIITMLLAVGVFLSFAGQSSATWVDDVRLKAEQGDAFAQTTLGACYELGEGVTADMEKAVEWYRKAAEQKWTGGIVRLGRCYARGLGVNVDHEKAVELWRTVIEIPAMAGTAFRTHDAHIQEARAELARALRLGLGTLRNVTEAIKMATPAAEWGLPQAEYELGMCYLEKENRNETLAKSWLERALMGGVKEAEDALKNLH